MPGKNPTDAFYAFQRPLQQDLSCISHDVLVTSKGGRHDLGMVHSLTPADGPVLITEDGLQLDIGMQYSIIKTGQSGKLAYRCTTKAYAYAILDAEDHAIDQLGVEPQRDDWDKVLAINEAKFELNRSWRDVHEAPRPAAEAP